MKRLLAYPPLVLVAGSDGVVLAVAVSVTSAVFEVIGVCDCVGVGAVAVGAGVGAVAVAVAVCCSCKCCSSDWCL